MKKENLKIFYNCINLISKESFHNFARISISMKLLTALVLLLFIIASISITNDFSDYDHGFANSAIKLLLLSPFSMLILSVIISLNLTSYSSNLHEFFKIMNLKETNLNKIRTFILYITTSIIFSFIFFFQGIMQIFMTFDLNIAITLVIIVYVIYNLAFIILIIILNSFVNILNLVINAKFVKKLYLNCLFFILYVFFYLNSITLWNNNLAKYNVFDLLLKIQYPQIISLILLIISILLVLIYIYSFNVKIYSIYNITKKNYLSNFIITKLIDVFNISKEITYFLRNKQTIFYILLSLITFIIFYINKQLYILIQMLMFSVIFITSTYYTDIKEELNIYKTLKISTAKLILAPLLFYLIVIFPHVFISNSIKDIQIKIAIYIFMVVGLTLGLLFPRNTSLYGEINYQISQIILIIILLLLYNKIPINLIGILIYLIIVLIITLNYVITFKIKIRRIYE